MHFRRWLAAMFAAFLLVGAVAGCSSDDAKDDDKKEDDSGSDTGSDSGDEDSGDEDSGDEDSGDEDGGDLGDVSGDCLQLSLDYAEALGDVDPTGDGFGDIGETFRAMAEVAPDDIKDDFETIADAYESGDLADLGSDDVVEASENISDYFTNECS